MEEEAASALGVVIFRGVFGLVRWNLSVQKPGFAVFQNHVAAVQVKLSTLHAFDFLAGELDTGFVGFEDFIIEAGAAIFG